MHSILSIQWLLVLSMGWALIGCAQGPAPPKRGKLEGKVTLNGKPIAEGRIRFMAIDPNGTNVAAVIKEGHYSVPAAEGPTKGKYRVEFSVPSATKRRVPNDDVPGTFMEEAPETLPEKYTSKSVIVQDYDPDQVQPLDYQLTIP